MPEDGDMQAVGERLQQNTNGTTKKIQIRTKPQS